MEGGLVGTRKEEMEEGVRWAMRGGTDFEDFEVWACHFGCYVRGLRGRFCGIATRETFWWSDDEVYDIFR